MISDATHTYRGYRLQALYGLFQILKGGEAENPLIFQPEGTEDLSIFDTAGNLLEVSQVKSYSANLTLSDFKPDKRNSFFHRAARLLKQLPNLKITIVSFGPIGPQLHKAIKTEGKERDEIATN
jgi:hypothetical protein